MLPGDNSNQIVASFAKELLLIFKHEDIIVLTFLLKGRKVKIVAFHIVYRFQGGSIEKNVYISIQLE